MYPSTRAGVEENGGYGKDLWRDVTSRARCVWGPTPGHEIVTVEVTGALAPASSGLFVLFCVCERVHSFTSALLTSKLSVYLIFCPHLSHTKPLQVRSLSRDEARSESRGPSLDILIHLLVQKARAYGLRLLLRHSRHMHHPPAISLDFRCDLYLWSTGRFGVQ